MFCAVFLFWTATAITSPAQTFKPMVDFDGANGSGPRAALVQGIDGNLYGTTPNGGNFSGQCADGGCGTIFKISPAGELTTIYEFAGSDGAVPYSGLVLGANGNFYGTTSQGGANLNGTVFRITPPGQLTTLYSFCAYADCTDGSNPVGGLVQASNGDFYGTTGNGGANGNFGTVFKITAAGALTTLQSFCAQGCANGQYPVAPLIQATDGDLYGTTGGGNGTVFKITPEGTLTTILTFESGEGVYPYGGLVQGTNGNFYGTTGGGGTYSSGTIFVMTPAGALTTLYNFCAQTNCTDGASPLNTLLLATDGDFYGGTGYGGTSDNCTDGCGTIFKITAMGALTTLYNFDGTDGNYPWAPLAQATSGTFYGTTADGGTSEACGSGRCGTLYSLSVGLGPFVKTSPTFGKVGASVVILGNNLTGATAVSFNGTAAAFTVESSSAIKATVPTGVTTGIVEVTTPSGRLFSNTKFRVVQ